MQTDRESCTVVGNELQKILTRFESVHRHTQESIEIAINDLESIQQEVQKKSFHSQNIGKISIDLSNI